MDALSLATDGIICNTKLFPRTVLPFRVKLRHNISDVFDINLNLKLNQPTKIKSMVLKDKNLNLEKMGDLKINRKFSKNLKITLKKCEE